MSKFYKINNKNIDILLIFSFVIIGILSIFLMQKEQMILNIEDDHNKIYKEIKTINDNKIAVLVDGKEASEFPSSESNYKIESIDCTNGVNAYWDVENWQLKIYDMQATSTKCTISFTSNDENDISASNLNKTDLIKLNEEINELSADAVKKEVIDEVYPVGSIYMSTNDATVEDVQTKFGGTWVSYAPGTTLISANTTYPVNTTGGNTTVNIAHTHGASTTRNGSLAAAIGAVNSYTTSHGYVIQTVMNTTKPLYIVTASSYALGSSTFTKWNHWTQIFGYTSSGGSTALNIINPYTTVYMYKRTA